MTLLAVCVYKEITFGGLTLTQQTVAVNLLSRLDRVPVTKFTLRVMVLLSFVWLAEAFDIGLVGPVLSTLEKAWTLSASQTGLLAIASTLGVVIGMIPSGWLADRIGRRRVVMIGILCFSVITLCGALAQNVSELFFVRMLAGIGEGAVLPMPYLFLSEFVRSRHRAVMVGYSNGILTAAYVIPSLTSLWALHAFDANMAWRVPFILGAIPLILLVPLFIWLPESPRFLLRKGRVADVKSMVERMEDAANLPHDMTLINTDIQAYWQGGQDQPRTQVALPRRNTILAGRTAMLLAQLTAALILFYILQVFGPSLLMNRGSAADTSILITGLMMFVAGFGSIAQGYLSDRFGRKSVLGLYALLASIGCILFAYGQSETITYVAAGVTAFFGLGIFPVSKLSVAEQYPTEVRGRAVYWNEMAARTISGIVTTYFLPVALKSVGAERIFLGIAIVMILFNLPFILFGRETANKQLEQTGALLLARE